jgi:hypothetical protein
MFSLVIKIFSILTTAKKVDGYLVSKLEAKKKGFWYSVKSAFRKAFAAFVIEYRRCREPEKLYEETKHFVKSKTTEKARRKRDALKDFLKSKFKK